MPNLIYSTELSEVGPWLVTTEGLIDLDKYIEAEWSRLTRPREIRVEESINKAINSSLEKDWFKNKTDEEIQKYKNEIREAIDPRWNKPKRELTLLLPKKATYKANSFNEALREQALISETPHGFEMEFDTNEVRCNISVGDKGNLTLKVTPEESSEAKEVFVTFREWVMKYRAPFWQRFFYQYSFLFFAFWFFLVAFLIGVLYPRPATTEAKERAKQLLNNGITNTNIPEAVELILIMETEYDPRSSTSRLEFPVWYKTLFYIGLAGCIAISCKPKTILGIGQGSEKISRWRLWYRFLGVVLPGLIFASFVWPYLEQVIRNFFN